MKELVYEKGLAILKKLLPDCSFEKNGDTLIIKQGDKTMKAKADFEMLFKLIDDDLNLRQRDSGEYYWKSLAEMIKNELNNVN